MKFGLKIKILAPILLYLMASSAFVSWYFPREEKVILENNFKEKIINLTENTAIGVGIGMGTGKLTILKDIFELLRKEEQLAYVTVYGSTKRKLAGFITEGSDSLSLEYYPDSLNEPFIHGKMLNYKTPIRFGERELGFISIGLKTDLLASQLAEIKETSFIFIIIQLIFGLIFSLILSSWITNNTRKILRGLQGIEKGDLTQEVKVNANQKDEFNLLALSMNTTKDALKNIVRGVKGNSIHLKDSLSKTTTYLEALSAEAMAIKGASNEMKAVVKETTQKAVNSRKMMEDITESSNQLSQSINSSRDSMEDITYQCRNERVISHKATENMNHLKEFIGEFDRSVQQVNEILSVIDSFAKRTNLLSLNASIEASGAGEAGRGFAVVAKEVKDLSRQIGEAVYRITQFLEEMEKVTRQAINSVNDTSEIINQYSKISEGIEQEINQQRDTFNVVSNSLLGNHKKLENARGLIQQMQDIISTVSHQMEGVDLAIDRTNDNIKEIKQDSSELEIQSETMVEKLTQFRIE